MAFFPILGTGVGEHAASSSLQSGPGTSPRPVRVYSQHTFMGNNYLFEWYSKGDPSSSHSPQFPWMQSEMELKAQLHRPIPVHSQQAVGPMDIQVLQHNAFTFWKIPPLFYKVWGFPLTFKFFLINFHRPPQRLPQNHLLSYDALYIASSFVCCLANRYTYTYICRSPPLPVFCCPWSCCPWSPPRSSEVSLNMHPTLPSKHVTPQDLTNILEPVWPKALMHTPELWRRRVTPRFILLSQVVGVSRRTSTAWKNYYAIGVSFQGISLIAKGTYFQSSPSSMMSMDFKAPARIAGRASYAQTVVGATRAPSGTGGTVPQKVAASRSECSTRFIHQHQYPFWPSFLSCREWIDRPVGILSACSRISWKGTVSPRRQRSISHKC